MKTAFSKGSRMCLVLIMALSSWFARGCSKDNSQGAPPVSARTNLMAGVTASDLRAEVTVPHLWCTVNAMWLEEGRLRVALHIDSAGGLGPVRVSRLYNSVAVGDAKTGSTSMPRSHLSSAKRKWHQLF
jgi:hypothetical protein